MKRSPKKTPLSSPSQVRVILCTHTVCLLLSYLPPLPPPLSQESPDEPLSHLQDDHATDEEKLASSTSHKWASLHDADLTSVQNDFPEPCDLTSFVNENSLSPPAPGEGQLSHHFPFVLKPPSTCVQIVVKQRQMVLRRNSRFGNTKRAAANHSLPFSNTIDFSCGLLAQFSTGL